MCSKNNVLCCQRNHSVRFLQGCDSFLRGARIYVIAWKSWAWISHMLPHMQTSDTLFASGQLIFSLQSKSTCVLNQLIKCGHKPVNLIITFNKMKYNSKKSDIFLTVGFGFFVCTQMQKSNQATLTLFTSRVIVCCFHHLNCNIHVCVSNFWVPKINLF